MGKLTNTTLVIPTQNYKDLEKSNQVHAVVHMMLSDAI